VDTHDYARIRNAGEPLAAEAAQWTETELWSLLNTCNCNCDEVSFVEHRLLEVSVDEHIDLPMIIKPFYHKSLT
jgi:hypothetical protein